MSEPNSAERQTVPRKRRGFETSLDMVRSMAVLAAAVGFLLIVVWRPHSEVQSVTEIDAAAIAVGAQQIAKFPLVSPDLGSQWQATSARIEVVSTDQTKHVWHMGFVGPDNSYVQLEQSDTALPKSFIHTFVGEAQKLTRSIKLGGLKWKRYYKSGEASMTYVTELNASVLLVIAPDNLVGRNAVSVIGKAAHPLN